MKIRVLNCAIKKSYSLLLLREINTSFLLVSLFPKVSFDESLKKKVYEKISENFRCDRNDLILNTSAGLVQTQPTGSVLDLTNVITTYTNT